MPDYTCVIQIYVRNVHFVEHFLKTQIHLLHCECNSRLVIKNKWFHDTDIFLQNERYTPSIVRQLFFNHLVAELYPNQNPPDILEYDDPIIRRAIAEQQKIGWNQLLYSRFSILWGSIIGRHLSLHQVPEIEMTMDRWGKILIKRLFQLMLNIWDCRNGEAHISNDRNESQLARRRLLDKIRALQESNPTIRYCDRDFVFCPLEILEQYKLGNLESWYRAICSILRAQQKYSSNQSSIRASFPVVPQAPIHTVNTPIPPPEPDPGTVHHT